MRRQEERQMGPGRLELKGRLRLYTLANDEIAKNQYERTYRHAWRLYTLPLCLRREAYALTGIHLWLHPPSAKCQPDKSQGLRVKRKINILTNRAESQESIMLSSLIGDDFISVLSYFSLLSVQGNINVMLFFFLLFFQHYHSAAISISSIN